MKIIKKVAVGAGLVLAVMLIVTLCTPRKSQFSNKCQELCEVINSKVDYCNEDKKVAICD